MLCFWESWADVGTTDWAAILVTLGAWETTVARHTLVAVKIVGVDRAPLTPCFHPDNLHDRPGESGQLPLVGRMEEIGSYGSGFPPP